MDTSVNPNLLASVCHVLGCCAAVLSRVTLFLDLVGPGPKAPVKNPPPPASSHSTKTTKFHDHNPYRFSEVDLEETVTKATYPASLV